MDKVNTKSNININTNSCLAAIIVTTDIEFESIQDIYKWKQLRISNTGYMYYETQIIKKGTPHKIIMTRQSDMGMIASAIISTTILQEFSPQYLIMTGVIAGIYQDGKEEIIYGDILAGNMFWKCTTGKLVVSSNSNKDFGHLNIISKPQSIKIPKKLNKLLESAVNSPNCKWPVHLGPIACSSVVMQNSAFVNNVILKNEPNTIGLDMESYSVAYTCKQITKNKTLPIIIKGVSDFADNEKSYNYQKYAAMQSCEFCQFLLNDIL